MDTSQGFWLFGYGSLIWKPPPHFDQRLPGYIEGYIRRFWQASEDHRGTPEAPGRVVTLIDRAHYDTLDDHHFSAPEEKVWGAAYHIPAEHEEKVRSYLDIREINGYSIQYTTFFSAAHSILDLSPVSGAQNKIRCLVYIGLPDNPQFLGPHDPQELAVHILKSKGPSGPNREYLYLLEESLLSLSPDSEDGHISDLAERCRELEAEGGWEMEQGQEEGGGHELHKTGSTEEQEEIEKAA